MRLIASLCYLLLLCPFGNAQGDSLAHTIPISVVLKKLPAEINKSQQEKLKTKTTQILTKGGMAADGWEQEFIAYPMLDIYEIKTINGYKKQTFVKAEFSLVIEQANSQLLFASTSKMISAIGTNEHTALAKAITSLKSSDGIFKDFLQTGRAKIMEYYAQNCDQILTKAASYEKLGDYGKAIYTLWKVPTIADCYTQVQQRIASNYTKFQAKNCKQLIQKAKATIAAQQYGIALQYLMRIDPESTCFAMSSQLIEGIKSYLTTEELKQWDFYKSTYSDGIALEKLRIQATVEIARAYAQQEGEKAYQTLIVK